MHRRLLAEYLASEKVPMPDDILDDLAEYELQRTEFPSRKLISTTIGKTSAYSQTLQNAVTQVPSA